MLPQLLNLAAITYMIVMGPQCKGRGYLNLMGTIATES